MGKSDPCYECKKRKIGCHSNCDSYLKWANDIRERRMMSYKKKEKEIINDQYQIDKSVKFSRKK